ncbi:MAG: thermonuclease family protein [Acidimicrobiia bacterium]
MRMRVRNTVVGVLAVSVLASYGCSQASRDEPSTAARAGTAGPYPVVDVVDGDTLKVDAPDRITVRVIGIDTPETVDPRRPVECFGREATARAHELLDGEDVTLESDPTQGEVDRFGRTLAYVWLPDGRSLGETLIREGYAFEYTYDTPYKYQAEYDAAEAAARDAERGLWAPDACA